MPKKSEGAPIPVGTLVRVKRSALTKGLHSESNRNYVGLHGYLHV